MQMLLSVAVLLAISLLANFAGTSEGTKFFDCRRHGYVCGAPDHAIENVTCSAEGDCECEKNSNYITVNNVCINRNESNCNKTSFGSGSVCCSVDDEDTCICTDDLTGVNCETPRFQVDCGPTTMTITVRPYIGFNVSVYPYDNFLNNHYKIPEINTTVPTFRKAFQLTDNTSGMQCTREANGVKYWMDVILHYSTSQFQSATDQVIRAVCYFNNHVHLVKTLDNVNRARDLDRSDHVPTVAGNANVLSFKIFKDGKELTNTNNTVTVGDHLNLTVSMVHNAAFSSISLQTLEGKGESRTDHTVIVENGCAINDEIALGNVTYNNDFTSATLPIAAFKFPDSTYVILTFTVELCNQSCSENCTQFHRIRRASDRNAMLTEELRVQVIAGDEGSNTPHLYSTPPGFIVETLAPEKDLMIAIIVLSVALAVFIVIVVLLCIQKLSNKKQTNYEQQAAYLPQQDLPLRIPRVRT